MGCWLHTEINVLHWELNPDTVVVVVVVVDVVVVVISNSSSSNNRVHCVRGKSNVQPMQKVFGHCRSNGMTAIFVT